MNAERIKGKNISPNTENSSLHALSRDFGTQSIMWWPHVTVAAIAERDGRFLMVEEIVDGKTVYNQPAGHLEANETVIQAVIRETLEESAWHFTPTAVIGVYFYTVPENQITYQRICFAGECTWQEPNRDLDRDILQALWLTPEELNADPKKLRSPMVLRCIDDYRRNIRYPLDIFVDVA